jgi:hypothetical protein
MRSPLAPVLLAVLLMTLAGTTCLAADLPPAQIQRAEIHLTTSRMQDAEDKLLRKIDEMREDVWSLKREDTSSHAGSHVWVVEVKKDALKAFLDKVEETELVKLRQRATFPDISLAPQTAKRVEQYKEDLKKLQQKLQERLDDKPLLLKLFQQDSKQDKDRRPLDEILTLRREINEVQDQIAAKNAQLARWEEQAKYATVTIRLSNDPWAGNPLGGDLWAFLAGVVVLVVALLIGWALFLLGQLLLRTEATRRAAQRARKRTILPATEIHLRVNDLDRAEGQLRRLIQEEREHDSTLSYEFSRPPETPSRCKCTISITEGCRSSFLDVLDNARLGDELSRRTWDRSHEVAACRKTDEEIEESLRGLLKSARNGEEMAQVRKLLTEARGRIEEYTAQLEQGGNQAPVATVIIRLIADTPSPSFGPRKTRAVTVNLATTTSLEETEEWVRQRIEAIPRSSYNLSSTSERAWKVLVPAERLDSFLKSLSDPPRLRPAVHESQEIDLTDQYHELAARLEADRAEEKRLQELCSSASGKLDGITARKDLHTLTLRIRDRERQLAEWDKIASKALVTIHLSATGPSSPANAAASQAADGKLV